MSKAAKLFEENFPSIADEDVQKAASEKQIVLSFHALPSPDGVVAKFVLADGSTRTMIMSRHVCELFRQMVQLLNENAWKVYRETPTPKLH